jgi:Icc-related predicted phosphoesterase
MKIALASDLHIEFGTLELHNTEAADVLVLAGDICVARDIELMNNNFYSQRVRAERYLAFFEQVSKEFPKVVYVMGNHEHYHGDFAYTYGILKKATAHLTNFYLLEKETLVVDDVTIIGATVWTDMNDSDTTTLHAMPNMMNDFHGVDNSLRMISRQVPLYDDGEYNVDRKITGYKTKESPSRFSPQDAVDDHNKALDYINHVTAERANEKFVVISHHCPSEQSVHDKYRADTIMNGGFRSNLDDFICYRPQIKLWCHGHTHEEFDYVLGETRVVCNPRGYIGHENRADYFQLKYIDV